MADEAYFAENAVFPGLEEYDLTSKTTAWIGILSLRLRKLDRMLIEFYPGYGGSYAGAFNAFLRVQYPHIFWGTISSSGVTKAIYDYWEYYEPIAQYGPPSCITAQKTLVDVVDTILFKNSTNLTAQLKTAFGLGNVTYDDDFANVLFVDASGLSYWQSLNWDPAITDNTFYEYCDIISNASAVYDNTNLSSTAAYLIKEAGHNATTALVSQMLNFIGWINAEAVVPCAEEGLSQDQCYSGHNATVYAADDLSQYTWRSWDYQVCVISILRVETPADVRSLFRCTQWGFLQTGASVPADQQPIISRLLDIPYEMLVCNYAFNITAPADVEAINKYGGYDIAYDRLAIIGGEWDPWRPATPQAYGYGAKNRTSTINEPDILIPKAVHHVSLQLGCVSAHQVGSSANGLQWDENGIFGNQTNSTFPPQTIQKTQSEERHFVHAWMEEWREERCAREKRDAAAHDVLR
ncbi:hypothetical protein LTR36_005223 [Oleoguttula mirabilis]|uniref:Serine carboxypeptidase n=1 Tax=Oleoguttula mirabilis TaxID=1507867 RepID=A0AAV9JWM0_9PEZI|nr:hypothetical protein LTR36_005223 [Oleoguttula mirabilis]